MILLLQSEYVEVYLGSISSSPNGKQLSVGEDKGLLTSDKAPTRRQYPLPGVIRRVMRRNASLAHLIPKAQVKFDSGCHQGCIFEANPQFQLALSLFLLSFLATVCTSLAGCILRLLLRLFLDLDNLHSIKGKGKC